MNSAKDNLPTKKEAADELQKEIAKRFQSQDDLEFTLGDTLDVKTNIALVVIVFLATQSAWFLTLPTPRHWHDVQIASVACLIVAGFEAMFVLIPRKYKLQLAPDEFLKWVEELKTFYGDDEVAIMEFMRRKETEKTVLRFAKNSSINARKSSAMEVSFYFTMASLVINTATLLGLASRWRF